MLKLKQWYINFLDKKERNLFEIFVYYSFCFLSLVYGLIVFARNFLYDEGGAVVTEISSKVVSIGNLSWAGSGKTTLSVFLYKKFSAKFKTAILRRGYGSDEEKLLKETTKDVFSARNRVALAKKLESDFEVFILDDGFQYRKLKRNIDIVIMGAREFQNKYRLIPANFFREPLNSLKRADFLILNYKDQLRNPDSAIALIKKVVPKIKIYFSNYKVKGLSDLEGREVSLVSLANKPIAAFTAIGYPDGFFNKLREANLNVAERVVYPDHHELLEDEFLAIENKLQKKQIDTLIITHKDKYHLPKVKSKLNLLVMEVKLEIQDEESFLKEISNVLGEDKKRCTI